MAHEYVYWNRDHTDNSYTDDGYTHYGTPPTDDWSKFAGNGHADHAYRPVMVDAQGRKKPVVLFNPGGNTEAYVTTETVVERFVPAVTEYRYSYPIRREEYNHCPPEMAAEEHKYRHPVRMEYKLCPPGKVEEQKYGYPVRLEEYNKQSSPEKAADEHKYGYPLRVEYKLISSGKGEEQKHGFPVRLEYYKRSSPVRVEGYGYSSPAKEPVHDRPPPEVEQIIAKIQNEVIRAPARPGPLTALNWRQPRDGNKPNRSDSFDDGNGRGGGKHAEWAAAPNSKLTRPTSDIGAAVEALKDAVAPSSGQHVGFPAPASTGHKYTGTIDSKTAEEKYNGATLTDEMLKGGKVR